MNSAISGSSRGRARHWLIGLALLGTALILTGHADEEKPQPGTLTDDLKLVPADAPAFLTVRVADLLGTNAGKKLMSRIQEMPDANPAELEKRLGISLTDIDRATFLNLSRGGSTVIIQTSRDYDPARVAGPKAEKRMLAGKTVYERPGSEGAIVYLAGKRIFVWGSKSGLEHILKAKPKKDAPLAEALKLAAGKHHLVEGIQPGLVFLERSSPREADVPPSEAPEKPGKGDRQRLSVKELLDDLPPEALPYKPLLQARWVIATVDVGATSSVKVEVHSANEEQARESEVSVRTALYVGRELLPLLLAQLKLSPEMTKSFAGMFKRIQQSLKEAKVEREKTTVRVSARLEIDGAAVASAVTYLRQRALMLIASNQLKQMGVAIHNHASANRDRLPSSAIYSKDGKGTPLLSWRVELLPYMEEYDLYKQFKLDEPWDSPHNKKLLAKMPRFYAPVVGKTKQPYSTYYRVFVGPQTLFDPKLARNKDGWDARYNIGNIPDGTSNTIFVVEAAEAVPWTKPDELVYDAKKPLPKLGGQFPEGFFVLLGDGSTRMVSKKVSEKTLRMVITPDDGNVLGSDW